MEYKLRNGNVLIHDIILQYEQMGYSDEVIGSLYGISRAGMWKLRRKAGWQRQYPYIRSDKGEKRNTK